MLVESPETLRAWLTKEMAPLCDAEPAALAKYVLALLRKDKPESELMEFCVEQLDVFLQRKAEPFVQKLFNVIRDRSYLPPPETNSPFVSTSHNMKSGSVGLGHEKKKDVDERKMARAKEREDEKKMPAQSDKERDLRKPTRDDREMDRLIAGETAAHLQPQKNMRRRISPPITQPKDDIRRDHSDNRFERRRSRSPRERRLERGSREVERRVVPPLRIHRQTERYKSERMERKRSRSPRSPYERPRRDKSPEPERKKKRCRDYDEKGYCMKGDQCIFDHGPDPVVVDDIALEKMVTNGTKSAAAPVAPLAANFSMPPPGYTPLNPPPPGVDGVYSPAASATLATLGISEGYNPEAPALSAPSLTAVTAVLQQAPSHDFSVPPPPFAPVISNSSWRQLSCTVPSVTAPVLIHPMTYDPTQPSAALPPQSNVTSVNTNTGGFRRGRGPNINVGRRFGQNVGTNTAAKALQVRKIPPPLNNITKLNEHFGQFGQLINIQVCYEGDPEGALITYATRQEAMAAYKSTAPILNNRFIKVFWHNPDGQSLVQGTNSSPQDAAPTEQPHMTQGQPTPTTPASAAPDKTRFIELRRQRKQDKENKVRLVDLLRRKSDLMYKEIDQQKFILSKVKNVKDANTRKKYCEIFKKLDESVKILRSEISVLNDKILKMNFEPEENDDGGGECSANGSAGAGFTCARSESGTSVGDLGTTKKNRVVDSAQALDKRTRVVAVRGIRPGEENDVMVHMENFGELVDMDFITHFEDKTRTAFFTYKKRRDAEQAVSLGTDFAGGNLDVKWASVGAKALDVVPDEKRKPSERVTPAALLATCPLEESDDDGHDE